MTDAGQGGADVWLPALEKIARASGHELRNALNALVVNLEVVRSRVSDPQTRPFVDQAVAQSEESVRLAEAAVAILNLVVGAVGADGAMRCAHSADGGVRIEAAGAEVERLVRAVRALESRGAVRVDTSESAVILSTPGS